MAEYWGFDPVDTDGHIFMSYNSHDWRRVMPIALELHRLGVPVWYDYGLEAGKSQWGTQISSHIERAGALVIFVTKGMLEREGSYVVEEHDEADLLDVPVIPVFLDNVTDKEYFKTVDAGYRRYVNFWNKRQGVAYAPDATPESVAQVIKNILDRSTGVNYSSADRNGATGRITAQETLRGFASAAERVNEGATAGTVSGWTEIGSRVTFGSYPQSNDTPEPIVWRVLDIFEGKALMISEHLLDCKKYNERLEEVTWETCTLRRWLNSEFVNRAFNAVERGRLCGSRNSNPDNLKYGTGGGNPTEDLVFCLSTYEADKYFGGDGNRKAKPTAFALKNGCYVEFADDDGWWWLRTPGKVSCDAAHVSPDGEISDSGKRVSNGLNAVRPVILVQL